MGVTVTKLLVLPKGISIIPGAEVVLNATYENSTDVSLEWLFSSGVPFGGLTVPVEVNAAILPAEGEGVRWSTVKKLVKAGYSPNEAYVEAVLENDYRRWKFEVEFNPPGNDGYGFTFYAIPPGSLGYDVTIVAQNLKPYFQIDLKTIYEEWEAEDMEEEVLAGL